MDIYGLQKLTLLDYPGLTACTVFLPACDFRCPFCHNWELIDGSAEPETDDEQLMKFLEKRRGILEGVAITGGEPTLNKDLPKLAQRIKDMGYKLKLDTNGNHPDMLEYMLKNGLVDYVAMDIKNSAEKYAVTIGLNSFDVSGVSRSIELLMNGSIDYEFRTTVVKQLHDEESFRGIGEWIRGAKNYYLQAFTDRDTVPFAGLEAPDNGTMQKYLDVVMPYVKHAQLRGV